MVTNDSFDRPREKLQAKGISSLSDTELLQLLIGSGNAKASVANIARKTHKALKKHGSAISYDQLHALSGLGIARACTILAVFELARRYPVNDSQLVLDTPEKLLTIASDIRNARKQKTTYITLDGARRMIAKRDIPATIKQPDTRLRTMITHYLSDNAASIAIVQGSQHCSIIPSLNDLQFAKELRAILLFFGSAHCIFYLVNSTETYTILDNNQ